MIDKWTPLRTAFLGAKGAGFEPAVHNSVRVAMGMPSEPVGWVPDDLELFSREVTRHKELFAEFQDEMIQVADDMLMYVPSANRLEI